VAAGDKARASDCDIHTLEQAENEIGRTLYTCQAVVDRMP